MHEIKTNHRLNPVVRKILKILGWVIASIIFLLVLVYVLIQIPAVQNFAKNKVVSYIEKKIKTRVQIGNLSIAFPKQIVLQNIYFEDQKKDTLLSGKEIPVDIALLKLISNEVNVGYLELKDKVKSFDQEVSDLLRRGKQFVRDLENKTKEATS